MAYGHFGRGSNLHHVSGVFPSFLKTLQLVLPLLRHLGPDLPNAEFGNGSATIHTVFTSGMSVMVLMIVETIQMSGSVVCI